MSTKTTIGCRYQRESLIKPCPSAEQSTDVAPATPNEVLTLQEMNYQPSVAARVLNQTGENHRAGDAVERDF